MDLPLHPKLVHFPIALASVMPLFMSAVLLGWWKGWLPRRAWWLAVLLQGMQAAGALAASQSGHADEEIVERLVPEEAIEAHEEAATLFTWGGAGLFLLALAGASLREERRARALALATTIGAVALLLPAVRTGEAGGTLVYRERAAEAHRSPPPPGASEEDEEEDTHEHDD